MNRAVLANANAWGRGWTPAQLSALGGLWDGDHYTAAIGTAADQSGLGRDMVQATSGKRPIRQTVTNNGRTFDAIVCDGTDDFVKASFTLVQPCYRAFILKPTIANAVKALLDGGATAGDGMAYTTDGSGTFHTFLNGNGGPDFALTSGAWSLLELTVAGGVMTARVNVGTAASVTPASVAAIGGVTLGAKGDGTLSFPAAFGFANALSAVPSTADVQKLRNYLVGRYGLALPSFAAFVGNSMTQLGEAGHDPYPTKVLASLGAGWIGSNLGHSGETTPQLAARAATEVVPLYCQDVIRPRYVLVMQEMGNDLLNNPVTAAQAAQNLKDYCAARVAEGWLVIATAEPLRTGTFAPADPTAIPDANAVLKADCATATAVANVYRFSGSGPRWCHLYIDLTALTRFSNPSDPANTTDGTHGTDAFYTDEADIVTAAVGLGG